MARPAALEGTLLQASVRQNFPAERARMGAPTPAPVGAAQPDRKATARMEARQLSATSGAGGGGAGGGAGEGGLYGGGGGGGGFVASGAPGRGGNGANGVIFINYQP